MPSLDYLLRRFLATYIAHVKGVLGYHLACVIQGALTLQGLLADKLKQAIPLFFSNSLRISLTRQLYTNIYLLLVSHYYTTLIVTNTIVLRKSNKDNYIESKSYRLIALLSIIGKALETIVIKRLSEYVEKYNLLLLK